MTTAMVSALTGIPVRADVAMTGEITLRGEVLAIGGLKEKLLAALRAGIKTALIPHENTKDLADLPEKVKLGLEIIPVKWIDQVLAVALERVPVPLVKDDIVVNSLASVKVHKVVGKDALPVTMTATKQSNRPRKPRVLQ
jgi:ATP-dependent Lon protease